MGTLNRKKEYEKSKQTQGCYVCQGKHWFGFQYHPRRLDGEKLRIAQEEFNQMEEMGWGIRRSDSPWSLPLYVVPKQIVPGVDAGTTIDRMWLLATAGTPFLTSTIATPF